MRVIELRSENFKRLHAVAIRPDSNLVQITGRNGAGKSSVLDSLWAAFAGKDVCPSVPIRKGQKRAKIRVDLGEIIVTRQFAREDEGSDYTTSITVENAEGARFPSPQRMLDALLGELSFDPLAFARMDPRAQFDALKRFAPGVDFAAIANADREDRDRRAELNRQAKQERAAAQVIVVPTDTPEQAIDEAALVAELETAGEHNATIEQRRANRERVTREIDELGREAEGFRTRAKKLREEADALDAKAILKVDAADAASKKLVEAPPLPEVIETAAIRERINSARAINANVRRLDERMRHHERAKAIEDQALVLTSAIEKREVDKQAAIAAAQMPVEGLGFGDDAVLLNGLPFEQASDAEQLRASVAIAMALNPKLRVIRIRDGSLLDEDAMRLLAEIADKQDFQCWIERVDSSGKIGFVLENGEVRVAAAANETTEAGAAA